MSNIAGRFSLPKFLTPGVEIGLNVFDPRTYVGTYQSWKTRRDIARSKKQQIPFRQNKKLQKTLGSVGLGFVLFLVGGALGVWQDQQDYFYDAGLQAYNMAIKAGAPENPIQTPQDQAKAYVFAYKAFDASMAVYQARTGEGWLHRFLLPKPDRHVAALASFQKGKILIRIQKTKEAVAAMKGYLMLNPGGDSDAYSSDTIVVQYDLELLYKQNPELQQAEGKGAGKSGKSGPGDQPAPDSQPGGQPGKMPQTKM